MCKAAVLVVSSPPLGKSVVMLFLRTAGWPNPPAVGECGDATTSTPRGFAVAFAFAFVLRMSFRAQRGIPAPPKSPAPLQRHLGRTAHARQALPRLRDLQIQSHSLP